MMFALCPTVTSRRPCLRAKSNANRTIRRVPDTLIGFTVTPASAAMPGPPPVSRCTSRHSRATSRLPFSNSIPA